MLDSRRNTILPQDVVPSIPQRPISVSESFAQRPGISKPGAPNDLGLWAMAGMSNPVTRTDIPKGGSAIPRQIRAFLCLAQ